MLMSRMTTLMPLLVVLSCYSLISTVHSAEAPTREKIEAAADSISCAVCKEAVTDVWDKSVARLERGDTTQEELLEKYVESRCTTQGLEDDFTIEEKEDGSYLFRGKNMNDYEAEGGVMTEVVKEDGTVEQHMEMKQTVTSEVNSNGQKRAIDPTTWRGIAIQQACRNALIRKGAGTVMSSLLFKKFWPEEAEADEDDEDVQKHAGSQAAMIKHVCKDVSKVCKASDLKKKDEL